MIKDLFLSYFSILNYCFSFITIVTQDAKNLLGRLLIRDPRERLGSGDRDAIELKEHAFFRYFEEYSSALFSYFFHHWQFFFKLSFLLLPSSSHPFSLPHPLSTHKIIQHPLSHLISTFLHFLFHLLTDLILFAYFFHQWNGFRGSCRWSHNPPLDSHSSRQYGHFSIRYGVHFHATSW